MKAKQLPTLDRLQELFEYKDGKLYWKTITSYRVKPGREAASVNKITGYSRTMIDGTRYNTHRVIWKPCTGKDPVGDIDHINQNKQDNRIENLRDVSRTQNLLNQSAKGVYYNALADRYIARIGYKGKGIHIGCFTTESEAKNHYEEFKELLYSMSESEAQGEIDATRE